MFSSRGAADHAWEAVMERAIAYDPVTTDMERCGRPARIASSMVGPILA